MLGTAGHVDHGKTSLVRALTGTETDRWAEERERGLTIDIGFASLPLEPDLDVDVIDVPGHEDFVKNMLAGSTGIDLLLLVVAADEGPMPQTREHLLIARLLGVREGVVALNKVDRVEDEWRALAREATREELRRTIGHDRWPIVDVSATTGEGLEYLLDRIRAGAGRVPERASRDDFRMPVDRVFSVRGAGTVVTGTSWSGRVAVGDTVRLLPEDLRARVRSLQARGVERSDVGPGRRCAMALVGVDPSQTQRGSVVVAGAGWRSVRRLGARIDIPAQSPHTIEHGQRVRLFLGTAEVMARVLTRSRKVVRPGMQAWVVLDCEKDLVARAADRFILRFYSPLATIGGGQVTELEPPRRWRRSVASWQRLLEGDPATAVSAAVEAVGGAGLARDDIGCVTGIPARVAENLLVEVSGLRQIGGRWYAETVVSDARRAVLQQLAATHEANRRSSAVSMESVRAGLVGRFALDLLDRAIEELAEEGRIVRAGPLIRLPEHGADLTEREVAALERLLTALADCGLEPPGPEELVGRLDLGRELLYDLLRLLVERGEVVAITPEMYVTRKAELKAQEGVRRVLEGVGNASPADFRTALGLSRKYLIPLLEHMDRIGVTRRTVGGRVLSAEGGSQST